MKICVAFAVALLAGPLLFLLFHTLAAPLPDVVVHGDLALIELATLKATRFEQAEGPYSRFKVHHPGPALFYWLAPFFALGGHRFGALCLGILLLNLAAFATLLLVPWRLAGARGALLASPFLILLLLHGGPGLLWSVWNPEAGLLPFAASAASAVAVAAGRPRFLSAGCFFGSFAAQCHVCFVIPLAATWLAAALFLFRRARAAEWPRADLAAATAIFLVFWSPVATEEWRERPGNLERLLYLKGETGERSWSWHGVEAGGAALVEAAWAPWGYDGVTRLEGEAARPAARLSLLLLLAAAAAAVLAWRRQSALAAPASGCLAALLAGAGYTVASTSGQFHAYLTRFLVPVGPLLCILLGCALLAARAAPASAAGRPPPAPRATALATLAVAAALALAFLASRDIARAPRLGAFLEKGWGQGAWGTATSRILDGLERREIQSPYIGLLDSGYWPFAAALADQIEKRGGHALVHEDWEFMFGRGQLSGAHDGLLLLDFMGDGEEGAPLPGGEILLAEPLRATLAPLPPAFAAGGRACLEAGEADFDLFLHSGFYDAETSPGEPPARWSRLDLSRLSIPLRPGRAYRFSFTAAPHEATLPQAATLALGGRELARIPLEPGWRTYTVDLPAGRVRAVNEIVLRYQRTVVPNAISSSTDNRCLALRFRSFCFTESAAGGGSDPRGPG